MEFQAFHIIIKKDSIEGVVLPKDVMYASPPKMIWILEFFTFLFSIDESILTHLHQDFSIFFLILRRNDNYRLTDKYVIFLLGLPVITKENSY